MVVSDNTQCVCRTASGRFWLLRYPHTWIVLAAISRMDRWSLGYDWTSSRNLAMRCIIQAFLLSKALGYWLLIHSARPIMLLLRSAVRLAHMSIEG